MTVAVLMAGGRSERMSASGASDHKSLVAALGVPLIERNLCWLLKSGFTDIVVAANVGFPAIRRYTEGRGRDLAASQGATLRHFEEIEQMGTAGAAVRLTEQADNVLSVFVDNLTAIDLRALLRRHEETGAALTLATHAEPFRLPFGEVVVRDGRILDYREKPVHEFPVSSGVFVVNRRTLDLNFAETRIDLPDLVNRLIAGGYTVAEFRHRSLWIDINNTAALEAAEAMILQNPSAFELAN